MDTRHPVTLDDPNAPIYTIGQVAEALSVQQAALRRLDEYGIISPRRSEGGQRRYSRADVDHLREALELIDEGLTLPGVRKVLQLRRRITELEDRLAAYEDPSGAGHRRHTRADPGSLGD